MAAAGFFGKIPSEGDFVRHNTGVPIATALDRWLQEGQAHLASMGGELPVQPTRFVFNDHATDTLLVGAMGPSRDHVGRKFTLAVFGYVPTASLAPAYSTVHIAFDQFLSGAARVLDDAPGLGVDAMRARVDALVLPTADDLANAREIGHRTLDNALVDDLQKRLFVDVSDGRQYYAYHTLLSAVRTSGAAPPAKTQVILDCPIAVDLDLFVWLELTKRLLKWPSPPSSFWLEDPMPRLLVSLGAPPSNILQFLANPRIESQRLWPLTTFRDAAVKSARDSIGPSLGTFGDGTMANLAELATALESLAR
jgi:type VI secretion system protein ImpM